MEKPVGYHGIIEILCDHLGGTALRRKLAFVPLEVCNWLVSEREYRCIAVGVGGLYLGWSGRDMFLIEAFPSTVEKGDAARGTSIISFRINSSSLSTRKQLASMRIQKILSCKRSCVIGGDQ